MERSSLFAPKIVLGARILLGLIFVNSGLNGFLQYMPLPAMPEPALHFLRALAASGYFLPLLYVVQLLVGILLLAGRFVPLALIVLAPVTVNIAGFHVALDPAGLIGPAAPAILLNLYLLFAYRPSYKPLLRAKATPSAGRPSTVTSKAGSLEAGSL